MDTTKRWQELTGEEFLAEQRAQATAWPSTETRRDNPHWTEKVPRPTAETWPYRIPSLEDAQAEWDKGEAARQEHQAALARLRADRESREAAEQATFDERRAAYVAAEDKQLTDEWRRRVFTNDPTATDADFEAALPEIRRQHRIDAALGRTPTSAASLVSKHQIMG